MTEEMKPPTASRPLPPDRLADAALSENARRVLEARYLRRDAAGHVVETPAELFARVARGVAHAELLHGNARQAALWEERFYDLLASLRFLPNSPTLMNAGTPLGQLAACFVLPVGDTMEEIFGALRDMALVQRSGGGTGFSFSRLRPAGDPIASTGGQASGPLSFMRVFDCATENIRLGGKRRGANMAVLRVDHPDILDFIAAKRLPGTFSNFDCSVGVTDAFLAAVRREETYALVHPRTGRTTGQLRAREVFDQLVQAAWESGDPGLLFLDAIQRANPTPELGPIEASNPCGEVPLLPYEACNLGSINLARLIRDSGHSAAIDWPRLRETVRVAVRLLDDVIIVGRYPTPEIAAAALRTRKIGLGVMGFAELLIRLAIPYDSPEAVQLADGLMATIAQAAQEASAALAVERGVFPAWERSIYAATGLRLRHATRTSIAPTGTISIIAGTTSGIEPLFALAYRRVGVLAGQALPELNPVLLAELERRGLLARDVLETVLATGQVREATGLPADVRRVFLTALEIPPRQHLLVQAAFQRWVDNSIAKTINLAAEATPSDVAAAYLQAHELGLKGVTVFRQGAKGEQVLELGLGEDAVAREYYAKCDPAACRL